MFLICVLVLVRTLQLMVTCALIKCARQNYGSFGSARLANQMPPFWRLAHRLNNLTLYAFQTATIESQKWNV